MKWIRSWDVPKSSGDGNWTVSLSDTKIFGCTCPPWIYRKTPECRHIRGIKELVSSGPACEARPEPTIVYAKVNEVQRGENNTLLVPLRPFDDTHFLLTLLVDLYAHGIRWSRIREQYELNANIKKDTCLQYIEQHGRKIYGDPDPETGRQDFTLSRLWPLPDIPTYQETPEAYHWRTGYPLDLCQRATFCNDPTPLPPPTSTDNTSGVTSMEQQQDLIVDGSDTVETVPDGDTEASEDETSGQKVDTADLVENDDDKTDSIESSPSTQDETAIPHTTKVAHKPRSQSVPASRPTTIVEEPEALCAHEPFDPELCTLTVTLQFLPRANDARTVILGLQSHSAMPTVHFLTEQEVRPLSTVVEDAILKWTEGLPALQTKLVQLKAKATPVTSSPKPASRTAIRKRVANTEQASTQRPESTVHTTEVARPQAAGADQISLFMSSAA